MNSPLSVDAIAAFLQPAARHVALEVVAETASTNSDLLARIGHEPAPDGAAPLPILRVAEIQSAGRGRAGRNWLSAPGAGLTFSLAWPFACGMQQLLGLPLAVGVSLAQTLADRAIEVRLKWPNDLLLDGAKLGGILIESAVDKQTGLVWAVIGVGLNLALPASLAQAIGQPAAALPGAGALNRNALMAALLNGLAGELAQFEQEGFAAFADRWNRLHAFAGRAVNIADRDKILHEGIAVGVDAGGRLLLDTAAGPVAVVAGDVSLRAK